MASSTSKAVGILGASGKVGTATIKALVSKFPGVRVLAGVRDTGSEEAKALKIGSNVELVQADAKDARMIAANFKGIDGGFVIVPGKIDRAMLGTSIIDGFKAAGAKFILVLSVANADEDNSFGRQFAPIEAHAKSCGIPITIIRLPLFIDNHLGCAPSIKSSGQIFGAAKPTSTYGAIAVCDIGLAAACILANPSPYIGKTFTVTGPKRTFDAEAKAFGKVLGKPIHYVQSPPEAAKGSLMGMGMPDWQAQGVLELMQSIDAGGQAGLVTEDFKKITGRDPMGPEQWMEANKASFM